MNNFMINILLKLICILLLLLGFFPLNYDLFLKAQSLRPELENLSKNTVDVTYTKLSPSGRYVLINEINEDSKITLVIAETQKPYKTIRKTNITKSFFVGNNVLVLKVGNTFYKLDLLSGKETEMEHVKNAEFIEKYQLLLFHYDKNKENSLEVLDNQFALKQRIDSVSRWQEIEGEVFVFQNLGVKRNLLTIGSDKTSFTRIWSSTEEVYTIAKSDIKNGGYVIAVTTKNGLKSYYVRPNSSKVELNDPSTQGFDNIIIKKSSDFDAMLITLSKRIPLDDKTVSVWYGKKKDLSDYMYGEVVRRDVLWYPKENRVVRLDPDYTNYTGIGKSNLFLRKKVDTLKVDIKDGFHRINQEEMHLWNSKTNIDVTLEKDGDVMYFDKEGSYILRFVQQNWKLLHTDTMIERLIDMPEKAVPHFTLDHTILWTSKGELWQQDLTDLKKKRLISVNADHIEILNKRSESTEAGLNRRYYYVDAKYLLLNSNNENDLRSTYFVWEKGKKSIIIPETTDRIKHLSFTGDSKKFVWMEENYNKAPVLMAKSGSEASKIFYSTNADNDSVKYITKKQLYYKGINNENLQASLFFPPNFDSTKKYPVVLWIYEKQQDSADRYLSPTFKNRRGFNGRFLLESGYIVLIPDINYGDEGPVLSALKCIDNALDELAKVEQADMKKVALMGHSFGGFETNFIATHSNRFAAYVSGASVSDIIHTYYSFNYNFKSPDYYRYEDGQFRMKDSFVTNKQKYFDNNPLYHSSKVSAPILLWTGEKDLNIDKEETKTFFNALRKYRKTVVALFYNNEEHTLTQFSAQKDLTLRILDWFDYFLKDQKNILWINKQMKDAL